MVLRIGQPAPAFSGPAVVDGEFRQIKLSDYKGQVAEQDPACFSRQTSDHRSRLTSSVCCRQICGVLLVTFLRSLNLLQPVVCDFAQSLLKPRLYRYPMDFTFVCPTEIIAFSNRIDEFRRIGAEVIMAVLAPAMYLASVSLQALTSHCLRIASTCCACRCSQTRTMRSVIYAALAGCRAPWALFISLVSQVPCHAFHRLLTQHCQCLSCCNIMLSMLLPDHGRQPGCWSVQLGSSGCRSCMRVSCTMESITCSGAIAGAGAALGPASLVVTDGACRSLQPALTQCIPTWLGGTHHGDRGA